MLLRNSTTSEARRGVILMVVLALLTLFAIVGLSFVLYAQAEADASRIFREDKTLRQLRESPDRMWSFALSKLIYDDYDDATGVFSALRGHSLARSMYGFDNYLDPNNNNALVPNQTAFNGTGRNVLATVTQPFGNTTNETQLINYTYFPNDPVALGQLHDPERLGWRAGLTVGGGPVTGGFNVSYTYPDLNNLFLGAVNAGGQVLMPSFHRPWLFGAIDPNSQPTGANPNANWTNPQGKYLTLRPRPFDHQDPVSGISQFPYPEDAGGDVKNLWWLPGGNDSIWVDLGYPVQTASDGRKYKPLFAFFITDLDNRINLNVHGNIRGANGAHVSNTGWGKWEVNVNNVLLPNVQTSTPNANAPANEGQNLFIGVGNPATSNMVTLRGRYGWDQVPDDPATYSIANGNFSQPGTTPHVYGQVDYNGCQDPSGAPTLPILLPGLGGYGPYNAFASFPAGYDNGNQAERTNHPLIYDFFKPFSDPGQAGNPAVPLPPDNRPAKDDRAFPASEMKELLNGGLIKDPNVNQAYGPAPQMAANAMKSQLGTLLPFNFNDPLDIAGSLRRRSLVTTLSMDVNQPGMMPWMWNVNGSNAAGQAVAALLYGPSPTTRPGDDPDPVASFAPWGNPSNYPDPNSTTLPTNRNQAIPFTSEFNVPSPPPAPNGTGPQVYPQSNWRAVTNGINPPLNVNPLAAIKPFLGKLDLTRPLQPYPNQIVNPATGIPNNIIRFDDDTPCPNDPQNRTTRQVYLAAQIDRTNMARDIYRLLRKLCGVATVVGTGGNQAMPSEQDLMPRRWLAQLAVNIVDFIDADDISTPFNFYPDNEQVPAPTDALIGSNPTVNPNSPVLVQGPPTTVYETLKYWVFGVEMPRVVLNEVFTEENDPPKPGQTAPYNFNINVWAELFCPMPNAVSGTVDVTDPNAVLLAVPMQQAGQVTYAPYRVTLANTVTAAGGPLAPRPLPTPPPAYDNDNVLGTPDQVRHQTDDLVADPTTVAFTGAYYTATNGSGNLTAGAGTATIKPQTFVVVGPGVNAKPGGAAPAGFSDQRGTIPNQLPTNTVCVPSQAMSYQVKVTAGKTGNVYTPDDRQGITVLFRRLANPRMPPLNDPTSPQFNPYVTVDYVQKIPLNNYNNNLSKVNYYYSYGKLQPYAADPNLVVPQSQTNPPANIPKQGLTVHTLGQINSWGQQATTVPAVPPNPAAYPSYDWLVHLDRALVSPLELLNVSFYHPHELTHRFIVVPNGTTLQPTNVPLPSNWKYKHTGLGPWFDPVANAVRTGPWFDQTTRLYRFLEFVETQDRAYGMSSDGAYVPASVTIGGFTYNFNTGVSSIGRRPGRVNINTVWDLEILNALLDPQTSNYFTANDIQQFIYPNLLNSRTPNYLTAIQNGTPLQALSPQLDRPFAGMASGHIPYNDPFYPNGTTTFFPNATGIGDTFLRPNTLAQALFSAAGDPTNQGHPELPRLFENPRAVGAAPSYIPDNVLGHPYLRFEPLNKVYNNLTTRSNVFGVWCTVGYFEVLDDTVRPVRLGAEIGKSAGTNVRHRFFSVIDRTEVVIAKNLINSASGAGGAAINVNNSLLGPGQQWVELEMSPGPAPGTPVATCTNATGPIIGVPLTNPNPGRQPIAWNIGLGSVLVIDRGTANEEWVQVTAVSQTNPNPGGNPAASSNSAVWVQANFIRPHNPGFGVTQPGNPGPQPPLDVRDYQHAPVIPVSVTIN
jgi:hypothetical protein